MLVREFGAFAAACAAFGAVWAAAAWHAAQGGAALDAPLQTLIAAAFVSTALFAVTLGAPAPQPGRSTVSPLRAVLLAAAALGFAALTAYESARAGADLAPLPVWSALADALGSFAPLVLTAALPLAVLAVLGLTPRAMGVSLGRRSAAAALLLALLFACGIARGALGAAPDAARLLDPALWPATSVLMIGPVQGALATLLPAPLAVAVQAALAAAAAAASALAGAGDLASALSQAVLAHAPAAFVFGVAAWRTRSLLVPLAAQLTLVALG